MENVQADDSNIYDEVEQVAMESFEVNKNQCYGRTLSARENNPMKSSKNASDKRAITVLFVVVVVLLLCVVSGSIAFTLQIIKLQSETTSLQN